LTLFCADLIEPTYRPQLQNSTLEVGPIKLSLQAWVRGRLYQDLKPVRATLEVCGGERVLLAKQKTSRSRKNERFVEESASHKDEAKVHLKDQKNNTS
jgi:hypothetical protein